MTVADLSERMTWDEFIGWLRFFRAANETQERQERQARAAPGAVNLLELSGPQLATMFKD